MTNTAVMGKILWVDLAQSTISERAVDAQVYRRVLAGSGLAAYLALQTIPPGADPLGEHNLLGFNAGLLTGTPTLFSGRWSVTAKSPLTGGWGEANCGGHFAPAIKHCGYDGIYFHGISPTPVYLCIDSQGARLLNAADLWGLDTYATENELKARHGRACQVVCIGPAGENLSLISSISTDYGRLAARSGLGAVMGSKHLKALVLIGSQQITPADPDRLHELSRAALRWARLHVPLPPGWISRYLGKLMRWLPFWLAQDGLIYRQLLRKWGTIAMNQIGIEIGDAPVGNWDGSSKDYPFSQSQHVNPDHITRRQTRRYYCSACPLGCGGEVDLPGAWRQHKPEFETVNAFGALLYNTDLDAIFQANDLLNRAGMDSISAGVAIAWALECSQRGLLPPEVTAGLELKWGDSAAILELVRQMIARQGLGALLADGVQRAVERLGIGAEFAMHAGGQELPMHDGRSDAGFALHYAVEPTPGRHTVGSQLYYEMFRLWTRLKDVPHIHRLRSKTERASSSRSVANAAVACSRFTQVLNGSGLCLFGAFLGVDRLPVFEWLNAATGWGLAPQEYMQIGARIQALKQHFNIRQGAGAYQVLPKRALGIPPQQDGANRGRTLDLDELVRLYWQESGWDAQTGLPPQEEELPGFPSQEDRQTP